MSKETEQLVAFGATLVNAGYAAGADGKVDKDDLPLLLPLLFSGADGIDGIKKIGAEQAGIGAAQKAQFRTVLASKLTALKEKDKNDWEDVLIGMLSVYRIGQRAGQKEILDQLEAGVSLKQMQARFA